MKANNNVDTILSNNIALFPDTDIGILKAYWKTGKDIIDIRMEKTDCLYFLQKFGYAFGLFDMVEMRGDFIDADRHQRKNQTQKLQNPE